MFSAKFQVSFSLHLNVTCTEICIYESMGHLFAEDVTIVTLLSSGGGGCNFAPRSNLQGREGNLSKILWPCGEAQCDGREGE